MTSLPPVYISLSSFGAAEVRRHGQLWFTRLSHAAGADGVEIRGELLTDFDAEVDALAGAIRELSLRVVYSSPDGLFAEDGKLDIASLDRAFLIAQGLGALRVKMSIGGFGDASAHDIGMLKQRLADSAVELVIENDQTACAGTVDALRHFFAVTGGAGMRLDMTFDMGNWHWTGECPQHAAITFASQVGYIHCKGVQRQPQRWIAVPLAESSAAWRTVLRSLPTGVPCAIEYPLSGDDLLDVTRSELDKLRKLMAESISVKAMQ